MESRLFDQEENTIVYPEESTKPPSPTSNRRSKMEIKKCHKMKERIKEFMTQNVAGMKVFAIKEK